MENRIYALLAMTMLSSATVFAQSQTGIIKERPAGRVINMSRDALMQTRVMTPDGGVPETNHYANIISEVVEGDDGYIYLKNPFTFYRTNSYIRGERGEGDKVIFHTPQPVYEQNGRTFYLGKICVLDVENYEDDQYGDPTEEEGNDIVFEYKDGVLKEVTRRTSTFGSMGEVTEVDASPIMALVTDNYATRGYSAAYTGYGDYNVVLEPVTDEPNVLPDNAQVETFQIVYTYRNEVGKGFVKVAFDGDDVYMNAFSEFMENAWAKGKIQGNTVVFDGPQYLGGYVNAPTRIEYAHVYFLPCKQVVKDGGASVDYEMISQLTFDYDPESKSMYSENGFAINVGKSEINEFLVYCMPALDLFVEEVTQLADPAIEEEDCGYDLFLDDNGNTINSFACKFSDQDQEGHLLNSSNLSYTIFKDDTPITITKGEFPSIMETYVGGNEFPFVAVEDENLYFDYRIMAYYFTDRPKVVSAQLNYRDENGTVYHSKRNGYDYVNRKVLTDMGEPSITTAIQSPIFSVGSGFDAACPVYDLQGRQLGSGCHKKGISIIRNAEGEYVKVMQ